jgi:aminoglycoside phosphotransferase family enzyme/predicted kinase
LAADLGEGADEVRQTHISWVFLTGDEVFKVKKPVDFGFLDFSDLAHRRTACEAEVTLNRELSPDVYLGLVPVTLGNDGVHRLDGDGEIVDWAVHMRRLPDADRLDQRLARGALDDAGIAQLAVEIARFHEHARADETTGRFGDTEVIRKNVVENFAQTQDTVLSHVTRAEAEEIESWQLGFLDRRGDLFAERVKNGRVRDGHGDLRLEQIYLDEAGKVRILDRIEFNERFRFGDVCSDVAFLSMDLAFRGRVDLAERFLALYARDSNDFDLFPLVDFYESYRAYVRAKIASMTAADEGVDAATRERVADEARRYYLLALAVEHEAIIPPRVVAVGGIIASGKSTIADRLSAMLGAPVVETDRTRKHMLGARPTEKVHEGSWSGAYDPAFTEQVYDEVYRRAAQVLASGRPVILDASFRSPEMRARAHRLAMEHGVPFEHVECVCDRETCLARLAERAKHESVSDGRVEIFDDFVAKYRSPDDEERTSFAGHVRLDTTKPLEESLETLREHFPTWDGLNA